jgi:hypothetical protein
MEPDSALPGTPSVVVLHPESPEDFHFAVIHPHRDAELEFSERDAKKIACRLIKPEDFRILVELRLGFLKSVIRFFCHIH